MIGRRAIAAVALAALMGTAGCAKEEKTTNTSKGKSTPAATQTPAAQQDAANTDATAVDDKNVPTEEDAEEAAEKTISSANVDDEVAKLEKEIGQP